MEKALVLSNHALSQYASRTGRSVDDCVIDLLTAIRDNGKKVTFEEAIDQGFSILRQFKGDVYFVWYDELINNDLLCIVADDGVVKTVLTKDIYSFVHQGKKYKHTKGVHSYDYGYTSRALRKKTKRTRRKEQFKNPRKYGRDYYDYD